MIGEIVGFIFILKKYIFLFYRRHFLIFLKLKLCGTGNGVYGLIGPMACSFIVLSMITYFHPI